MTYVLAKHQTPPITNSVKMKFHLCQSTLQNSYTVKQHIHKYE